MAVGEWDQRQLCPDGACVGVIGPDGTCKVCGRAAPNWGDERNRGLIVPPDDPDEGDDEGDSDEADDRAELAANDDAEDGGRDEGGEDRDDGEDEDDDEGDDEGRAVAASPAPREWSSRQLCPDGSCIGLIGADGRCKVCGRRADEPADTAPGTPSSAVAAPGATRDDPDERNNTT